MILQQRPSQLACCKRFKCQHVRDKIKTDSEETHLCAFTNAQWTRRNTCFRLQKTAGYLHALACYSKKKNMNESLCVGHSYQPLYVVTCWFTMMRLIVCAVQANDVSHTHPLYPNHHPLPNQQIWLQLAGGEDEAACAAQLRKTLNNLLNRWQCALIPHSPHSLHCLPKRKQHHTSLWFNRPATLWITCLVDEDSRARKSLVEAVRKSVWQWAW